MPDATAGLCGDRSHSGSFLPPHTGPVGEGLHVRTQGHPGWKPGDGPAMHHARHLRTCTARVPGPWGGPGRHLSAALPGRQQ